MELGARLECSPSTVRRWWRLGDNAPTSRALRQRIARTLRVPLAQLEVRR